MTKQDYIQTQPITKALQLTLCNRGVEEAQNHFGREYEEATDPDPGYPPKGHNVTTTHHNLLKKVVQSENTLFPYLRARTT